MRGDFHIHSKYSFDSISDPKDIIKVAKKRGLDGIAVTDHDTIKGGLETSKLCKGKNFFVIIGEEIHTDMGDIIGLFLNEEIKSRRCLEVIEEIKGQGGVTVLPHPFRGHKNIEEIARHVDLIEVFNSRCSFEGNKKAEMLAEKIKKKVIAGSDAHSLREIGYATVYFEGKNSLKKLILNGNRNFLSEVYTPKYLKVKSYLIKALKTKEYSKIPYYMSLLVRK